MIVDALFIASRPLIYVPLATLALLVSTIWLKNSSGKLKVALLWLATYLALAAGIVAVAYTQHQYGCGFGLGDCYNDKLPDGFWALKLVVVLAYYAWFAAAILSTLRRLMGVSDRAAKKGALLLVGALSAALTAFLVYLSTFGS